MILALYENYFRMSVVDEKKKVLSKKKNTENGPENVKYNRSNTNGWNVNKNFVRLTKKIFCCIQMIFVIFHWLLKHSHNSIHFKKYFYSLLHTLNPLKRNVWNKFLEKNSLGDWKKWRMMKCQFLSRSETKSLWYDLRSKIRLNFNSIRLFYCLWFIYWLRWQKIAFKSSRFLAIYHHQAKHLCEFLTI